MDVDAVRWLRRSVRRPATDPPVDEVTVDAYERMLANTEAALEAKENRLLGTQARIEAILTHLAERHRWAGKTRDEALGDVKSELFDLWQFVVGKAK